MGNLRGRLTSVICGTGVRDAELLYRTRQRVTTTIFPPAAVEGPRRGIDAGMMGLLTPYLDTRRRGGVTSQAPAAS
jgi:hypothetical protein